MKHTEAEMLLDAAWLLMLDRDKVDVIEDMSAVEVLALAFRLRKASPGTRLRAMMEGWNRERIIREMY